ncbi:MAG: zinc-ribbon domain-containing protein [Anaerolineales bacterium]|nr:zinc-ribbon domain-containing protein [Anaerolineales bacterium]
MGPDIPSSRRLCSQCGQRLDNPSRFCPHCGTNLQ